MQNMQMNSLSLFLENSKILGERGTPKLNQLSYQATDTDRLAEPIIRPDTDTHSPWHREVTAQIHI